MSEEFICKKTKQEKNREATIRHYILGFILEATVKNDIKVTTAISDFLTKEIKITTEDNFIYCLKKARANRSLLIKGTKKNYKEFKKNIVLNLHEVKDKREVIKRIYEFSKKYEGGIFVKSDMAQCSYEEISYL